MCMFSFVFEVAAVFVMNYVLNVNYCLKMVIVLLSSAAVVDFTLKPETDYDVLQQYV